MYGYQQEKQHRMRVTNWRYEMRENFETFEYFIKKRAKGVIKNIPRHIAAEKRIAKPSKISRKMKI